MRLYRLPSSFTPQSTTNLRLSFHTLHKKHIGIPWPAIPHTALRAFHRVPASFSLTKMTVPNGNNPGKPVLFFDIDNCLYPRSSKVQDLMAELIDKYFSEHLSLPWDEAVKLHKEYYTNYGLAIEGLVRHHQIDPLEYNAKVDDALPLEDLIKPNPELRQLLEDIDRSKVRLWLFTNAYVNHGKRVVRLLGIDDLFEGLTFCDYSEVPLVCKPHEDMFKKAMKQAGVERAEDCYFVDDSFANCAAAKKLGWTAAHLVEEDVPAPKVQASQYQIRHLRELRQVYPQFFKSS
ncbi:pyrimidine 5-nucleotidase [Trichoderma gracile]